MLVKKIIRTKFVCADLKKIYALTGRLSKVAIIWGLAKR